MPPAIGIDLGTTNSCVAVLQDGGKPFVIPDMQDNNSYLLPSIVAFLDGEPLVGNPAKRQASRNLSNTVFGIKRFIGCKLTDEDVKNEIETLPFKIVEKEGLPAVEVKTNDKLENYRPEQISAYILRNLRERASNYLGVDITDAVVTVPAYFGDSQRQATQAACTIAGLNVLRLVNEPTAAAIAYGLEKVEEEDEEERNVLVYDLGGGTFDVSLLTLQDGFFEVEATQGNGRLGGQDFDNLLMKYLAAIFARQHREIHSSNHRAFDRLRTAAREAKHMLSTVKQFEIYVDALIDGNDFIYEITRDELENLLKPLVDSTLPLLDKVLHLAKMGKNEITDVVLVGGSTRIRSVQNLVSTYFPRVKHHYKIDPDVIVASGAAILASSLQNKTGNFVLQDVTSRALGIRTSGDQMSFIVEANSRIPTKKSRPFTTSKDNQTYITVAIFEGEDQDTRKNRRLGQFVLGGITPAPRHAANITVTFEINENAILTVTAEDDQTDNCQTTTLNLKMDNLSEAEIDRMKAQAEAENKRQKGDMGQPNKRTLATGQHEDRDIRKKVRLDTSVNAQYNGGDNEDENLTRIGGEDTEEDE